MPTVCLDGAEIRDWDSFHAQSKQIFGFPDFYANNMDAWVDCLSYLRDAESMTRIHLGHAAVLQIDIVNADIWRAAQPEMFEEVLYCINGINERYADYGEAPALTVCLR